MSMTINTNIVSINAQRNLGLSGNSLSTTMQRLSSGLRVNSAKDDAAGLAIAERMNTQVRGLAVAARNANDGISLAQTAEGALGKMGDMLQRMRELAVQSSNATNSTADREALQSEVSQLRAEIDRVAKTTSFNGQKILDGSFAGGVFQVGAGAGDNITVGNITNAKVSNLGSTDYGFKGLDLDVAKMTDLTAIDAGELSIKVGNDEFEFGAIAKANSSQERAGQIVSAINAKTADTGVTAFLTKTEDGKLTIDLRSKNVESVTEMNDANPPVEETSIKAVAVTLSGFTEKQTGLESVELDPELAPKDGNGYVAYGAILQGQINAKLLTGANPVTLGSTTATDKFDDVEDVFEQAIVALNTNNLAKYEVANATATATGIDGHGLTGWTLDRVAGGAYPAITSPSALAASTGAVSLVSMYEAFGGVAADIGTATAYANSMSADEALAMVVDRAQNFTGDVSTLTAEQQKFHAFVTAQAPQTYTDADFLAPSATDEAFDLAEFDLGALMADAMLKTKATSMPSYEDVFGANQAWVDVDTNAWESTVDASAAKAAFAAAQEYVTKQGALGINADNVENQVGMEELSITTQAGAWAALQTIDSAIDQVNSARADLGALQTRFEKSIENIDIMSENTTAARGRIVDADFASETANLSRAQILQQAGTAMVAQANQLPQNVLSLLR